MRISSSELPADIPVIVVGLGSNLIVRDGGVPGVVIRLGRGFSDIKVEGERIRTGTAVPDVGSPRRHKRPGLRAWPSCAASPAPSAVRCA